MQQGPQSNPRHGSVVIVESKAPPTISIPPSARYSMRSVSPLAASMRPRSIFPSEDASANLPARRRRTLARALVAVGVLVGSAGLIGRHPRGRALVADVVSGKAGLRTTPSGADESWSPSTPPAFVLDPSLDAMGAHAGDAKGAIVDAFTTWDSAGVGLPKASFSISSSAGEAKQDGVSRILYAPITVAGMEDALALTVAYADAQTGVIKEADVIFNSKYKFRVFSTAAPQGDSVCDGNYDVQNVATHETGHVYGLGEDLQDTTTTMYIRSSPCETHKRTLSSSDQQVMTALYASSAANAQGTQDAQSSAGGCGGATVASKRPGSGASAWVMGALVLLVARRRGQRRTAPSRV